MLTLRPFVHFLRVQLFEDSKKQAGKARKDKTLQRISILAANGKSGSAPSKKGLTGSDSAAPIRARNEMSMPSV